MIFKSVLKGSVAAVVLLLVYFGIVSWVSGWDFARSQFGSFWYFIVSLAVGFGVQIALYSYLRMAIRRQAAAISVSPDGSGKILAVSGTTSTAAMISCCAHYLTNILPVIGTAGAISLIGQYQIELFWVGLAFNLAGILFMVFKITKWRTALKSYPASNFPPIQKA